VGTANQESKERNGFGKGRRSELTDWRFIFEKWVLGKHRPAVYEPAVKAVVSGIKGNCFLDIGANVGVYSLGFHKNFQQVHAFEPNPSAREELLRQAAKRQVSNLKVWPYALSDTSGRTTLFLDPHVGLTGSADTILSEFDYEPASQPQSAHTYRGEKGVIVETRTLDSLEIPRPFSLVKIDVEGAEFRVLQGARTVLRQNSISHLIVELHNRNRKLELEALLEGYGYSLKWVDPDHLYSKPRGTRKPPLDISTT
jgi:FkbM family methyltransferase